MARKARLHGIGDELFGRALVEMQVVPSPLASICRLRYWHFGFILFDGARADRETVPVASELN
jgi:hypothetical protein